MTSRNSIGISPVPTQHAAMTSHGTTSRGISRDLRVFASDVTQPSPGSLPRYGSQTPLPGNSDARTIEGYIRGIGMSKKSVVK
jgi:hypothetical protein